MALEAPLKRKWEQVFQQTGLVMLPLLSFITLWDEVQQARAALTRVQEILNEPPETARPVPGILNPLGGHVRFDRVSFSYGGPRALFVLKDVSFDIPAGEAIALVGRSGSGKSTLARLLMGLYPPTAGRILIDGADLRELDIGAYRRQLGIVLQENLLTSGTIAETIAVGEPEPDPERIIEVAQLAGAHEFINALPGGYESLIGTLGLTLSGGQRQRISLARALYRNPRIVILDEATNALDNQSKSELKGTLETALAGRTVLIIAHDRHDLGRVDRMLVLEEGMLVERSMLDGAATPHEVACSQSNGRFPQAL
jgi:subfamily B ATP-binding cassette protein HlyB/CyaB